MKRPKCLLVYRTHIWPFKDEKHPGLKVDYTNLISHLTGAIQRYNSKEDRKYDYDFVISLHNESGQGGETYGHKMHHVTIDDILSLGLPTNDTLRESYKKSGLIRKPSPGNWGNDHTIRGNPMWFSGDYAILDYYLRCDDSYDYYWNIELDTVIRGKFWKYLFSYDDVEEDFLVYRYGAKSKRDQWWPWWDVMIGFEPKETYGSFFPIFRLSKKAIKELIKAYRNNTHGYCESFVPTYLNHIGLSCGDLACYNSFYKNECKMYHKYASQKYRIDNYKCDDKHKT